MTQKQDQPGLPLQDGHTEKATAQEPRVVRFGRPDGSFEAVELLPMAPDRHPQHEIFLCDISDAIIKDVTHHMEHPIFSLATRPDTSIKRYRDGERWIEIVPSVKGRATIFDKDILIYCISQLMAGIKAGRPVSRRVRLTTRDLLIFSNRGTSGKDYAAIIDALDRLRGTQIRTNIRTNDIEESTGFGLIDASAIRRKHGPDGRLLWCDIYLSDWVFRAIEQAHILTLHRDYFRLRRPLDRRLYEIARKHCGRDPVWRISLSKLHAKTGSGRGPHKLRSHIKALAALEHGGGLFPDYRIIYEDDSDIVQFVNRNTMPRSEKRSRKRSETTPQLRQDTLDQGRKICPDESVLELADKWWRKFRGHAAPRDPDAAFLGFARKYASRSKAPRPAAAEPTTPTKPERPVRRPEDVPELSDAEIMGARVYLNRGEDPHEIHQLWRKSNPALIPNPAADFRYFAKRWGRRHP